MHIPYRCTFQIGIGSEPDCLFGQLYRIFWISDSEAGGKDEKSTGIAVGDSKCGDAGCL